MDVLGPSWSRLGSVLKLLGAVLGASWGVLGRLGRVLGRLGSVLDASWGVLGASWAILSASWTSWGVLGSKNHPKRNLALITNGKRVDRETSREHEAARLNSDGRHERSRHLLNNTSEAIRVILFLLLGSLLCCLPALRAPYHLKTILKVSLQCFRVPWPPRSDLGSTWPSWPSWNRLGIILDASWVHLGAILARLGRVLGRLVAVLGRLGLPKTS